MKSAQLLGEIKKLGEKKEEEVSWCVPGSNFSFLPPCYLKPFVKYMFKMFRTLPRSAACEAINTWIALSGHCVDFTQTAITPGPIQSLYDVWLRLFCDITVPAGCECHFIAEHCCQNMSQDKTFIVSCSEWQLVVRCHFLVFMQINT